jgi:catechol 2,3-dioxygenase-like lactoylglutathione lyase family enzyme
MITGINHVTLAVSNLARSFAFYVDIVGLSPAARWARGAYLEAGDHWICLTADPRTRVGPLPEYSHLALSISREAFAAKADLLTQQGVVIWKDNSSEGDSLYFLDPDGHKLELHVGDLATRLAELEKQPYEGLELFDRTQLLGATSQQK